MAPAKPPGGVLASLRILLGLDATGVGTGVAGARRQLTGLQTAVGIGAVAIVMALGAAVSAASSFESQLNTINTVAKVTPQALHEIGDGILEITTATGLARDDVSAAYYDIVSAGIDAADAQDVLTQATKLAVGGLGTEAEAVDALTTAINAYGGDASKARQYTDELAWAINAGKVKASEIAESYANVALIAANYGIENREIAASYAVLTAKGQDASQMTIYMRQAINALTAPTKSLLLVQKEMGVNLVDMARDKGLIYTWNETRKVAEGMGIDIRQLTGRVQAQQFIVATTGENWDLYRQTLEDVDGATLGVGEAQRQMDLRQQGLNFQLGVLRAQLDRVGIIIGRALLPVLTPLVEHFGNLVGIFGDLLAINPQVTGIFVGILAVMSTILALKFGWRMLLMFLPLPSAMRLVSQQMLILQGRAVAADAVGASYGSRLSSGILGVLRSLGGRIVAIATGLGTAFSTAFATAAAGGGIVGTFLTVLGGIASAAAAAAAPIAVLGGGLLVLSTHLNRSDDEAEHYVGQLGEVARAHANLAVGMTGDAAVMQAAWGSDAEAIVRDGATIADAISDLKDKAGWTDAEIEVLRAGSTDAAAAMIDPLESAMRAELEQDRWNAYVAAWGTKTGETFMGSVAEGVENFGSTRGMRNQSVGEIAAHQLANPKPWKDAGIAAIMATAQGMFQEAQAQQGLMGQLRAILKDGLTPRQAAIAQLAKAWIQDLGKGFGSEIAGAKEAAQATALQAILTFQDAGLHGAKGQKSMKEIGRMFTMLLGSGMTEKQILTAFESDGHVVNDKIKTLLADKAGVRQSGVNITTAFMEGAIAGIWANFGALHRAYSDAFAMFHGQSPPKVGPLKDIDHWGTNVARAWTDPFIAEITRTPGRLLTGLSDMDAVLGRARIFGEDGSGRSLNGASGRVAPLEGSAGASGLTINGGIHIDVDASGAQDAEGVGVAVEKAVERALDSYLDRATAGRNLRWSPG